LGIDVSEDLTGTDGYGRAIDGLFAAFGLEVFQVNIYAP
jgi:hypothetical protein